MAGSQKQIEQSYMRAKELYAQWGVNTDQVLARLAEIPISLHCWQGDDVAGFEGAQELTGGIQVTGNYPAELAQQMSCGRIWKKLCR